MGKITTITPIHIASGYSIYCFKKDGLLYPIDVAFDQIKFTDDIKKTLLNPSNASQNSLAELLNVNELNINEDQALSKDKEYGLDAKESGKFLSHISTMGNLYIPGSSLKGAIMNTFWYYTLKHNNYVREEIINQIKNKNGVKNRIATLENSINKLSKFLMISDSTVKVKSKIFNTCRINKKLINGQGKRCDSIPIGNVEVIDKNEIIDFEINFGTKKEVNNLLNQIIKNINNSKDKSIIESLANDMANFILYFKDIFPKANRELMLDIIDEELFFANHFIKSEARKEKVDIEEYKNILLDIKLKLENGITIMQIGKYTNYMDKSCFIALGSEYKNLYNFQSVFTPNKEKKKYPVIDTCNLMSIKDSYYLPFGYIQIDL